MDFHEARNEDHLLVPFECDLCIFRKLRCTDPISNVSEDNLLLAYIIRINLDTLWSQKRLTVQQNTRLVRASIKFPELLGLKGLFEHNDPYPCRDCRGYDIASNIFLYYRNQGKHDKSYNQFETIRKLRTVYRHLTVNTYLWWMGNVITPKL